MRLIRDMTVCFLINKAVILMTDRYRIPCFNNVVIVKDSPDDGFEVCKGNLLVKPGQDDIPISLLLHGEVSKKQLLSFFHAH
jgi:hypothetical protein